MSNRVVLVSDPDGDPDEGALVEFRLTYEGPLLGASRSNTRAKHKHEIRKRFHRQLKRVWHEMPHFTEETQGPPILTLGGKPFPDHDLESLAERYARNGYRFVPIVTDPLQIMCGLDILFLRSEPPGAIFRSGDIDNRLKTLFDALRLPMNGDELGGYTAPDDDENPFFCLLEDDRLISKVSVETDTLWEPVKEIPSANDARLVITVRLKPYLLNVKNMHFG